jgi:hypothetical protein
MKFVAYGQVHPALIGSVYYESVVGHDEEGNIVTDPVIMELKDSPDNAAFCGYKSVIKVLGPRALFALKGTHHR